MPVVVNQFGIQNSSDAQWPYRQATWQTYKIDSGFYNDGIGTPNNFGPVSYGPTRGRVIRGLDRAGQLGYGTRVANIAPLYGIWKDMLYYEYYRRWGSQTGGVDITPGAGFRVGSTISYYDLNRIRDAVQTNPPALGTAGFIDVRGVQTRASWQDTSGNTYYFPQAYGYYGGFGGVNTGQTIYAQNINDVIDKIIGANNVCVCNCNYCTCNCNYCACNCNYACTCNCNYSDSRLKTNIEQIGTENELKVYTWSYIWDLSKQFSGVIAQELIGTKYESALEKDSNGYYFVDYSQLPVEFKAL
jgi:Chaperone of endosialidase